MLINYLPVSLSHTLIVLSQELDTIYFPSDEKFTLVTLSVCPSKFYIYLLDSMFQILIVLSIEQETMCIPSGE